MFPLLFCHLAKTKKKKTFFISAGGNLDVIVKSPVQKICHLTFDSKKEAERKSQAKTEINSTND